MIGTPAPTARKVKHSPSQHSETTSMRRAPGDKFGPPGVLGAPDGEPVSDVTGIADPPRDLPRRHAACWPANSEAPGFRESGASSGEQARMADTASSGGSSVTEDNSVRQRALGREEPLATTPDVLRDRLIASTGMPTGCTDGALGIRGHHFPGLEGAGNVYPVDTMPATRRRTGSIGCGKHTIA